MNANPLSRDWFHPGSRWPRVLAVLLAWSLTPALMAAPKGGTAIPVDCALTDEDANGFVDYLDANLNELKSKGGGGGAANANLDFAELKILQANVDIDGWKICYSSDPTKETCENLGNGKAEWFTVAQMSGLPDDEGPDPINPTVYQAETWIVLQTTNLKADEGEVILFNDRNEVVDYIRYSSKAGICSDANKRWDVDETVCGTCFDERDPDQKDFARTGPDGTGDWGNNGDTATEGGSNDGGSGPTLGGFSIDFGAPAASTCLARAVSITALDDTGAIFTDYAGTVGISTSSGHGNWAANSTTNPLVPSPDNDDDGAVAYTFDAAGDAGAIVLDLTDEHAESLQITVTDSSSGTSVTSGVLSFGDNAFVISNTEFANPVAGRDHAFTVSFFRRDPTLVPPECAIATGYTGARAIKGWFAADASHPAGAAAPSLVDAATGVAYPLPAAEPGAAAPSNLTLTFVNGSAAFALRSSDVGKYGLNIKDDSGAFAAVTVSGGSATETVRPFGLKLAVAGNPGATTPAGAVFAAAGAPFALTVSAVRFEPGDTVDPGTGAATSPVNDNTALTAGFAAATALTALANTPAAAIGGVSGLLDRAATPGAATVAAGEYGGGSAAVADLRYAEVGSIALDAAVPDYLATAGLNLAGSSAILGRFRPDHFKLALNNAPAWSAACVAFTYLGQAFGYGVAPSLRLSARNAQDAITANYRDFSGAGGSNWWTLADTDLSLAYSDVNDGLPAGPPAGVALSGAAATVSSIAAPVAPSGAGFTDFNLGGSLVYPKPVPATHGSGAGYAAFDASPRITLSLSTVDGGIAVGDDGDLLVEPGETLAAPAMRHGRLQLVNAHGSELTPLSLPLRLEYFNGVSWLLNPDDNDCGALAVAHFGYTPARPADALGAPLAGLGSLDYSCSLATPCALGAVDILGALGASGLAWLRYDWNGDGTEEEPGARASFGIFLGNQRQIYMREMY